MRVTCVSCGCADSGNIVRAFTSAYSPEVSIRTSKYGEDTGIITHGKHTLNTESEMAMTKCVHIHHQNMYYQIENMFCIVVKNVHFLIFQVQNQISIITMLS